MRDYSLLSGHACSSSPQPLSYSSQGIDLVQQTRWERQFQSDAIIESESRDQVVHGPSRGCICSGLNRVIVTFCNPQVHGVSGHNQSRSACHSCRSQMMNWTAPSLLLRSYILHLQGSCPQRLGTSLRPELEMYLGAYDPSVYAQSPLVGPKQQVLSMQ